MPQPKKLFYDCEISKCIPIKGQLNNPLYSYCKGGTDFKNMGVSVIGCYMEWIDEYLAFTSDPLHFQRFQSLVDDADEIIGYYSLLFDDRLLHHNGIKIKTTYDLLKEIRNAVGRGDYLPGYKLGEMAEVNLGYSKTGSGLDAPILWQDGKTLEVIQYCLNDVKLLVELYNKRKALIEPVDGSVLVLRD